MRKYRVYQHSSEGWAAVKQGFSWPGFFLPALWMLSKRPWGWALLWALIFVFLIFNERTMPDGLVVLGLIVLHVIPGVLGNSWRHFDLLRRGCTFMGEVDAKSHIDAIQQFGEPGEEVIES